MVFSHLSGALLVCVWVRSMSRKRMRPHKHLSRAYLICINYARYEVKIPLGERIEWCDEESVNNVVVRHHRDVTVEIIILIVWAVAVMFLLARSQHKRKEECCNQCLEILHFSFVLFSGYKDSANRVQNKISSLIFYAEVQPILSKVVQTECSIQ